MVARVLAARLTCRCAILTLRGGVGVAVRVGGRDLSSGGRGLWGARFVVAYGPGILTKRNIDRR